ncbi:glycosyltransferase family 2 protein [Peteryoungia desertarenae]|nr:glycosyltransferase [Peteryoungia desertarenae]
MLKAMGLGKPYIASMARRALAHGTTIEAELLASGTIQESAYYAGVARMCGLQFLETLPDGLILDSSRLETQLVRPQVIRLHYPDGPPLTVIVPEIGRLDALIDKLATRPSLKSILVIAAPSVIRQAVWKVIAERRCRASISHLFEQQPQNSARVVMTGLQGYVSGVLTCCVLFPLIFNQTLALLVMHVTISSIYFASLCLRLVVTFHQSRNKTTEIIAQPHDHELPVYTVLIALYREEAVVPQLIEALARIDWPQTRLDVKLVCEANDRATIAAIHRASPPAYIEIVEVPDMAPRTKPKALNYALASARGELLTIYDAEDRPHPLQLREAYQRFRTGPPSLACLQAPLVIANAADSWISAIFALEYSALFKRLLPMLAHYRMPLPLGGTSNHFRRDALIASGGWDPFNVTEDADLGLRLHRLGYLTETLTRPTLEDAPTQFKIWLGQRTRWYKGWMQTWLVAMRDPLKAGQDMGWMAFVIFQLLIGGMLLSSLVHPALFLFIGLQMPLLLSTPVSDIPFHRIALLTVDLINIIGSYALFIAVGTSEMTRHEKQAVGRRWLMTPVYWMAISLAGWRALRELKSRPFFWAKTPHKPSAKLSTEPA